MNDATPVLYALIIFLTVVVVSLMLRLNHVQRYLRSLKKTLLKLEGEPAESAEEDRTDRLGD